MTKKMKIIPSILKNKQAKHPWQWPSCKHPKASSFRGGLNVGPQESSSSNYDEEEDAPAALEAVISRVRMSKRLFFEPEETSSIMRESRNGKNSNRWMFKDSVAMALESEDPYLDFKRSMEEMVESKNLLQDWDCLEELLVWYLRMNGKINHGFIVGAFVDLLVGFSAESKKKKKTAVATVVSASDSMSTTTYYSSASSSFSSPSSPSLSSSLIAARSR